jgi:hypothetical protein
LTSLAALAKFKTTSTINHIGESSEMLSVKNDTQKYNKINRCFLVKYGIVSSLIIFFISALLWLMPVRDQTYSLLFFFELHGLPSLSFGGT